MLVANLMEFCNLLLITFFTLQILLPPSFSVSAQDDDNTSTESNVFRVYIGAGFKDLLFSDVPVLPNVEFHFILAFALDFTDSKTPFPTNDGIFNVFWDKDNLSPEEVTAIKDDNENVKVVLSIGGFTCGENAVKFDTNISVETWVSNAVDSLTEIITEYNLDVIDIDYEQFIASSDTFSECMGQLVNQLKESETISIASIAPYGYDEAQNHYQTLWKSYGYFFDYVNFQFYAYEKGTSMSLFLEYFDQQISNYQGGNIVAGFSTDVDAGGLSVDDGFFDACEELMSDGKLGGIFVWSADDSKDAGFSIETQSQIMLAAPW